MKTKYIRVKASERLPEKSGFYYTSSSSGIKETAWFMNDKFSYVSLSFTPEYWLEEVPDYEDEMREMLEQIYLETPNYLQISTDTRTEIEELLTKLKTK